MLITVLWILVGAAAGGMLGGSLSDLSANHAGDIGRIFAGLVAGAIAGTVAFGLAGQALNRKIANDPRRRRMLIAVTWLGPALVVLGGVLFETVRTRDQLNPSGGAVWFRYEVRLPPGAPVPSAASIVAEFRSEKETRKQSFPGHDLRVERDGDRVVIQGSFETYRTAQKRVLRLRIGNGPTYLFDARMLPRPPSGYARDWDGPWRGPTAIDDNADGKPPRSPQPGENLEFRAKIDMV